MKIQKQKMKPMLYGTALAVALSFWTPGLAAAEQAAADEQNNGKQKTALAGQLAEDVPETEIEVKETKEKKKNELSIGQPPNAEGVHNYVVTRSSTGSKSDIESKDLPQTITVIGQKTFKDQHVDTAEKALTNIAGINTGIGISNASANLTQYFFVRGFLSNNFFYDGLSDYSGAGASAGNSGWMGNLDRIEVLKGPSSVLYGRMVPGGIINYITKRPLTEESITIGQEFGSWGSRTTDIDASIPLTQDKRWLSRTIISTDQLAGFQKDINNHHFNGSVIIQGKPKDDTTYTLIGNYNNYNLVGGAIGALPSVGTIAPPYGIVPYDGNYFNPDYRYYFIGRSITGRVEHKINDIWSVTSSLRYSSSHNDRSQLGGYSWANPGYTTGKILSTYKWDVFNQDSLAWDTTGNAKFKTGGLDHNLVLGYGWARFNRDWPISVYKNFTGVDIYNPIWDPRPVLPLTPWIQGNGHTYNRSSYLSDTVSISDKLKVTGGISRASYYESFGGREQSAAGNTWRLGTTYETKPGVTLFTGYSTSFDFNSSQTIKAAGQNIGTQFFKPKTGNQLEGGIKYDVSDKASVTLSVYDIHQRNIVNNAGTSNDTNWELIGEQESKGIELDASYVIRPGWNLLAAFSNAKSRIVEDALHPEYVGKQAVSVPTQTLKLWSTYEFQDGPRKGWGFGGGITHVSDRAFDTVNSLWVPGFTTIDGIVYYKTQDWSYSLNLYNLTNRQYWVGQTSSGVFAGTPRSFTFRAERTF